MGNGTFNRAPAPPQPPTPDASRTYRLPDVPFFSQYFTPQFGSPLKLVGQPVVLQRNARGRTAPYRTTDYHYQVSNASVNPAGEIVLSAQIEDGLVRRPLFKGWELLPLAKLESPVSGHAYGDYVDNSSCA